MRAIIVLAVAVLAGPAIAQSARAPAKDTRTWTAAPTSGETRSNVAPADRAGTASSSDNGVLFSGTPTGAVRGGGGNDPASGGTTPAERQPTPDLGK